MQSSGFCLAPPGICSQSLTSKIAPNFQRFVLTC